MDRTKKDSEGIPDVNAAEIEGVLRRHEKAWRNVCFAVFGKAFDNSDWKPQVVRRANGEPRWPLR